jgi:hypothetical protein
MTECNHAVTRVLCLIVNFGSLALFRISDAVGVDDFFISHRLCRR